MARLALICAIALGCVCGGYGIPDVILKAKKYPTENPPESQTEYSTEYPSEYTTEYSTEYSTGPTDYTTEIYTDEYNDQQYPEASGGPSDSHKVQFRCPRDGLFGYPQDCTHFIQCSHGHAYFMPCPAGLHFNVRTNRCDYPCEAQCNPAIRDECGGGKKPEGVCTLPAEKGKCHWTMIRYYYDIWERKCKTFVYGGCHGNGNNFKSAKHCWEVCGKMVAHGTNTQDSYPRVDPYDYRQETTSDDSWMSETTSDNILTREYPAWTETETTEDYLPHSRHNGPQEPEEHPWGPYIPEDSETPLDWDSNIPSEEPSPELPEFSADSSSTEYSFKARVVDNFECRGNGSYRNPDDCSSFIWCPVNRPIVVPCPPNTHYSEQRDECVDPCLAHCNTTLACSCGWPECHQYNHFDCESDPDVGPCKARIPRYYYDREAGRCKRFYYGGCHGNGNNYQTLRECQNECKTSLLAGFRCPSYNGDFGHYPDCVSYYQCKRGIPTLKRCPEGMAFHHLKSKCVPEKTAMCVYECREPNAVYPAPKDCRSYIDCVNGIPKLKKCPRGLAFDAHKKNCVLERATSCHWF